MIEIRYNRNVYTINFDSKGGTAVASQSVRYGGKAREPSIPSNGAYSVIWYISMNDGETLSDTVFDFVTEIMGDTTLYAKWAIVAATSSVVEKINDMGESGVVIVQGVISSNTLANIKAAISKKSFGVGLDLSGARGITSIGPTAFSACSSLASITIPDSVTSIGKETFSGCSKLTSITFTGTKEQWNAITKGLNWNKNVPASVVRCSDGEVSLQ